MENDQIRSVNRLLNAASTCFEGLSSLLEALPRCSTETLSEYASLWLSKATEVFKNNIDSPTKVTLACRVLVKLMHLCKNVPDAQKQISMQYVKQWVTTVANCKPSKRNNGMFYLLSGLLNDYKESAEKMQTTIRPILLLPLDSESRNLVQGGANCFTLLARAVERSFKPPASKPTYSSYIYEQLLLCNSLHAIMDELFSDIIELETIDSQNRLELKEIHDDDVTEHYAKLRRRFSNLCSYLSTILGGCGDRNSTNPTDILRLLCRGLAVTPANVPKEDFSKRQLLLSTIPQIHVDLLRVLDALVDNFEADLVPNATTILRLFTQTLKWTRTRGPGELEVRTAVYSSLTTWMKRLHALSYVESIADTVCQHIFEDIFPARETLTLLQLKPTKERSKRRGVNREVAPTVDNPKEVSAKVVRVATTALENILAVSGPLTVSLYSELQQRIVPLLFAVYRGVDDNVAAVYKDPQCRLGLLKVLEALQFFSYDLLPPPTQYCVAVCNFALEDANLDIVTEARSFLARLDIFIHPRGPTLLFPVAPAPGNPQDDGEMEVEGESNGNDEALSVERVREIFKMNSQPQPRVEETQVPTIDLETRVEEPPEPAKPPTPVKVTNGEKINPEISSDKQQLLDEEAEMLNSFCDQVQED